MAAFTNRVVVPLKRVSLRDRIRKKERVPELAHDLPAKELPPASISTIY
jgi:hypothetical protein